MNGTVDDVTCFVDAVIQITKIGLVQNVAMDVNFDQARGGNLFIHHAVGVDQKSAFLAGHTARDVIGHHVGHAINIHQAITRRQVDTGLPLLWRAAMLHRFNFQSTVFTHFYSLRRWLNPA